ncbi:hypothetical protein F5Y19DRAFT_469670 [Xylariaceae sp. FL1651]|nr:hypothetical protein F5Y19DRAFT_469670 [Xylariaceae sp. FL1651]
MAPVPFKRTVRYPPLILAGTHLSLVVYLTYAVGDSLYTSYKSLAPASNTRSRIAQRRKFAPLFLGLATTALSVAVYCSVISATLSYKTWAYEHGLDLAQRVLGEESYIADSKNLSQLYIAQWLSDTPIYHDALEIVAEKARRFWWGQQVDLATMAFSMTLAIEGRRRKIPLLTAFLVLAHLVNLSFSQNLFYLALLLTPSPLPSGDADLKLPVVPLPTSTWIRLRDKLMPPKPVGWVLNHSFLYAVVLLHLSFTFVLPYAAETSSFATVALLARASTFLPLVLPKVVPVYWGNIQLHLHSYYDSTMKLFRFISTAAFFLHAKTSFVALVSNTPNSHYHRHSTFLPWDVEERSLWERSTTALGKVLGSLSDHPVVTAVGWDALVCTLSLGLWAAVRGTSAQDIIKSSIPFYKSTSSRLGSRDSRMGSSQDGTHQFSNKADSSEPANEVDPDHEHEYEHNMTLRRRGKLTGSRVGSIASSSGASEDVLAVSTPSKRRRGRPRKAKQQLTADETDEDRMSHRSEPLQDKDVEEDKAYVPTPSIAKSAFEEGDELPPQDLDWESASLTWGLAAFGGLASACAGVFGGECISR